jgi:ABC-type branched-subunit amino acid transport system permease subunit
MPIRGSPNGARHHRPQAGRDRPEWVVAINRNAWSQSIGIAGRDPPVRALVINGAVFRLFGGVGWGIYLLGGGSMYLPRLSILGREFAASEFIPAFYTVIVAAFIASAVVLWRISRSPFGKALMAIRDNETRAAFIGIPVRQYRWYAFIISGFFMGLAGALYGQLARQITPDQLHWLFSAQLVLATVLGGTQHFLGPVIGAFAFVWRFGVSLIVVVLAFPQGIAAGFAALRNAMHRQ